MKQAWVWRRAIGPVAVWIGVGGLCSFVLAMILNSRSAEAYLTFHGDVVLEQSVAVARAELAILDWLAASPDESCSPADLADIRRLSFVTQFLGDVGRTGDGALLCTAVWGVLDPPVPLPPPSLRLGDGKVFLWKRAEGVLPVDLAVDMAAMGNGIAMTAPAAFAGLADLSERFSALLTTRDGGYIYRTFGTTYGLSPRVGPQDRRYRFSFTHLFSRCDDQLDICVVARYEAPPVWQDNPLRLSLAVVAGMAIGGVSAGATRRTINERMSLRQQLRRAVEGDRLLVLYQPIVRLSDRSLCGAEALVRLVDFDGRIIPPSEFIDAAETFDVLGMISRKVIRTALREMEPYLEADPGFYISVNVSAGDFLDPDFMAFLHNEVSSRAMKRDQLALELTERSTANQEQLAQVMQRYSRNGYRILIDDFGTGYSNLSYIASLPLSGIKIDRMFIQALDNEAVGAIIVHNICELATELNVDLICEGIENETQIERLMAMKPDMSAQGYLFGRPEPADRLAADFLLSGIERA